MRKFILLLFLICTSCTKPLVDAGLDQASETPPESFDFILVQNIDQKILVSWSTSKGAKTYELSYGTATGVYTTTVTGIKKTTYTIEGLSAGQIYYFKAKAVNDYGSVESSSEKSFTHMGPPGAFTLTTAVPSSGRVVLTWAESAQATSYTIKRGTSANDISTTVTTTSALTYNVTGLTNTVTYYFKVIASNAVSSTESTNSLSAKPDVPPTVPLNAKSKVEVGKCVIEWDPPASGAPPLKYTVRRIISGSVNVVICDKISTRTCAEESLSSGTYNYRVEASNDTGTGPQTSNVVCTLALPTNITGPNSTTPDAYASAVLTWSGGTGSDSFTVKYGTVNPPDQVASTSATSPYTVTGLTNGTTYYFQVVGVNGYGTKDSGVLTFKPIGKSPTITPGSLPEVAVIKGIPHTRYFTIADPDAQDSLICSSSVSASSSAPLEIPDSNITIGGTAPNCSVTVTAPLSASSVATITLSLTDGANTISRDTQYYVLPAAERIYSLRRFNANYNGPTVKVRRASDSLTMDIGFDTQGNLNYATYNSFRGGSTLHVQTWYDQGPSGFDITESDPAKQPTLVASSSTTGYVVGDGINQHLTLPSFNPSATMTFFARARAVSAVDALSPIFSYATSNSTDGLSGFIFQRSGASSRSPEFLTYDSILGDFDIASQGTAINTTDLNMAAHLITGSNMKKITVDGSQSGGSVNNYLAPNPGTPFYLMAAEHLDSFQYGSMQLKEFLIFRADLNAAQINALGVQ